MAFYVSFGFDDRSYSCMVRRFYVLVHRDTNEKERPLQQTSYRIALVIDATDNQELINWMLDPGKKKDGFLAITEDSSDSKYKEVKFTNAFCVVMTDEFLTGTTYATTFFVISGGDIKIGGALMQR